MTLSTMLMIILVIIYFLLFSYFAWKNLRLAVGIFIILLPAYLIRFNIGPLPTTLLEISFGALFFVWLIKYFKEDRKIIWEKIKDFRFSAQGGLTRGNGSGKKILFIFIGLFFIASVAGIFVSDMWYYSLGQWRAYFLEPMILFFILLGRMSRPVIPAKAGILSSEKDSRFRGNDNWGCGDDNTVSTKDLVWFLILSTISVSIIAIIQKITGQLYPPSLWDDNLDGRATSFFTTPNAIGLYIAPIIPLILAEIAQKHKLNIQYSLFNIKNIKILKYYNIIIFILALLAIVFSFSQGAWIALGAGLVMFAYLVGYKKTAVAAVLAGIILAFSIAPIRSAVMFQDKAGQNRLELWSLSWNYLKSSPKNFIFGTGIRQFFRKVQKSVYEPKEMERLIYPHNIFLNFWTETGFFGMISFAGILFFGFYRAFIIRKNNLILGSAIIAALAVFITHGMVDVPYFKNDLAFLFWIIFASLI